MAMKKRALLVGVNKFNGFATPLEAPEAEVQRWADLLYELYGFPNPKKLIGPAATRDAVLKELKRQLTGLGKDDQFILFMGCHGRYVKAHEDGAYAYEEAAIVWPKDGDDGLRSAEITDSDLTAVFKEMQPPKGTDLAFIADLCFSGGFGGFPAGAKPLFIPPVPGFERGEAGIRELGAIVGPAELVPERPIVVAACGRDEVAVEMTIDGARRLLFSAKAIKHLRDHPQERVTFRSLVHDIRPLHPDVNQTPDTRGNTSRDPELFPGEPEQAPAAAGDALVAFSAARPAKDIAPTASMNSIEVRIKGICCFADARRESDPYKKRLLLPYDDRYDPALRHISFLEIDSDDYMSHDGPLDPLVGPHKPSPLINYHRWNLGGHEIRFAKVDQSKPLEVTASYRRHVPGMVYAVYPKLPYNPKDECFTAPNAALLGAYIDLQYGTLTAGPLQTAKTRFESAGSPSTSWFERTPEWCSLHLDITDTVTTIYLIPFDGGDPTTIKVRAGGSVLIGNERETDIMEEYYPRENPRENFRLYYLLSPTYVPPDAPLPYAYGVPLNACSNTNWP
jgi:hypothetical protein